MTYDKGGWVMWTLTNLMGRDAALAGLREFIDKYGNGPDYPVLQDLVATLRPHAPDPAAFDAFVKDWFFGVVVPEYRLTGATKKKVADGPTGVATTSASGTAPPGEAGASGAPEAEPAFRHGSGPAGADVWETTVSVTNAGKGAMPVQVAAVRGERFTEDGKTSSDYRDARTSITLGPGESRPVTLRGAFEPDCVVVDPDATVLQLQRKLAIARF